MRLPTRRMIGSMLSAALLAASLSSCHVLRGPTNQGMLGPQPERDVIEPDLAEQLARLKEGEFLRIIIRLQDQMDAAERRALLAKQRGKDSRKALVKALQAHAARTQRPILERLAKLEADRLVRNIRPLWISSVIGLEARREAIEEIATWGGIQYLKQDIKRQPLQLAPAWGVSQINADDVWALPMPITGDGVVVAVLDSGMDLDHPDLVGRLWINPGEDNGDGLFTAADINGADDDMNGYIDDVVGWDLGNNDNSPDDWHGHGTHVAGTVAGDGTGGTATGVAPGARIMVLSYSADPFGAGQMEAWEGMQYALQNGADIVNFSSGWKDAWSPDYATWRQNSDTMIDAGVLFVVSAGNDNPHVAAPGDVLTPARVPRVVAVGATDNTDTIAGFSANGPTSWESVIGYADYIHPPGLLKPDVSAPGVAVTSTQNGGGYVNGPVWSGTSMAAPHVSGTAALLLEQDPGLLPHELAYILRETAVDLGVAGEDNVYGYGRIDALAAINHLYSLTPSYDLSVTGTNAVWTTVDIWVDNNDDGTPDTPEANIDNHLYARVRNVGGQAVGNVEIKFYYADVGTIGISGFDPNNDGDPDDGNFNYIDSYFVPVIGPAGSSQDTAVGVVNWNVPVPVTDHWCVGIGIVAPNPPNAPEGVTTNNRAFRNFFDIIVVFSQTYALQFFVYPDPRRPFEPFDLEFVRKGLPKEFEVQLGVEKQLAERWFRRMEGFRRVERRPLKNLPLDEELALQRGEKILEYARLQGERGRLEGIAAPRGEPVLVNLAIRAPDRRTAERMERLDADQLLVVNARNAKDAFGGFTINVKLRKRPDDGNGIGRAEPRFFRIQIEDALEARLIQQELKLVPVRVAEGAFYYYGDEAINKRLRAIGYRPAAVDPNQVLSRMVRIDRDGSEKEVRDLGARVMLRESDHWVVRGTLSQIRALSRLGYRVREIGDREPRPREVRIRVPDVEHIRGLAPLLADIYGEQARGDELEVFGAAWDDMIDKIRDQGYSVEVLPPPGS